MASASGQPWLLRSVGDPLTEGLTEPQIEFNTFISHRKELGGTDRVMRHEDVHRPQALLPSWEKISSQRKENACPRSPHVVWPDPSPLAHFTLPPFYLKHRKYTGTMHSPLLPTLLTQNISTGFVPRLQRKEQIPPKFSQSFSVIETRKYFRTKFREPRIKLANWECQIC